MELQPHQQRVVAEKAELDEKLAKMDAFGRTPLFASLPADEQGRLNRQHSLMEQYSAVLGERIAAFTAWQPIETAPRDGSLILGTDGLNVGAMWWDPAREPGYPWAFVGEWMGKAQENAWQEGQHGPKHWMPLPAPPKSA